MNPVAGHAVLLRNAGSIQYPPPRPQRRRAPFLDGTSPADLPRTVEIVPTDGLSLRRALLP